MDRICENCGNMIPEGQSVCPSCGWESDAAIQAAQKGIVQEKAERPEKPDAPEGPDRSGVSGDTEIFDASAVIREEDRKKKAQRGQPAKNGQTAKNGQMAKNGQRQRPPQDRPAARQPQKTSGKKKKKKTSKGVVGACVALAVILVIIVAAAVFLLRQMGFFETMTDDELLGAPVVSVEPSPSEIPTIAPSPSPTPVPESVPEEGSDQEENAGTEAPPEEEIECTKFKITGTEYPFLYSRGETVEVVYVIEPSEARDYIQWESSDTSVATVSTFGVISARRGGSCTVTGTCGDKSVTVYVTCDFTVPGTIMDMNYEDVTMDHEGQTLQLEIDYDLTADQRASTVWESSDEEVATVDGEGLVTAIADGTAVITATIGEYTASCIVRCVNVTGNRGVNNIDSEYVINYEDVTLSRKGEYFQLTLTSVLGEEVPSFTWKSDDTDVATVDSKGVVTAVSDGTAYVTATVGGDQFRCIVRVHISD